MKGRPDVKILYTGNKLSQFGCTPGVIETLGKLLENEGFRVFYAGTRMNKFLRLKEMLWTTITLGRKVDYILIDTYSTSAFWYAYLTGLAARLVGTKYIPILHGGNLPSRLKRSKRACDTLFTSSFKNVAVSGYLSHEFEMAGYETVIIPNSIDISMYLFKQRQQPKPRILWVRSFHRQYNPIMAADVLKELLNTYPETELCMVGPDRDGSMGNFKEYIESLGIAENVKITGLLKKEEWIKLSENYDIFINTTNVDNTPVSVIEAMALGLVIVSTDSGGLKYVLKSGENSIIIPAKDYEAMCEEITKLLSNINLYKMLSVNARKDAELYNWDIIKDKWFSLLSE
jgi:glycosyltransferase involved in cell wall biosynthesis